MATNTTHPTLPTTSRMAIYMQQTKMSSPLVQARLTSDPGVVQRCEGSCRLGQPTNLGKFGSLNFTEQCLKFSGRSLVGC